MMQYVTSRKVAGSSSCKVIDFFFNLHYPSSRTVAPRLIQPLTELGTRNCFLGVERCRRVKASMSCYEERKK
jgi:hypothetical protein